MSALRLPLSILAGFVFLMLSNMFLFPVMFPDGQPDIYKNVRTQPIAAAHVAALFVTALLLGIIFPKGYRDGKGWVEGLRMGLFLGLLASVPMTLHVYGIVDAPPADRLTPVLWTLVTWGFAGAIIGAVFGGLKPR